MVEVIENLVFLSKLVGEGSNQSLFLALRTPISQNSSSGCSEARQGQSFPCLRLVSTLSSDWIFSPLAVP